MVRPDWVWITPAVAEAAHAEQIAEHGGGGGLSGFPCAAGRLIIRPPWL